MQSNTPILNGKFWFFYNSVSQDVFKKKYIIDSKPTYKYHKLLYNTILNPLICFHLTMKSSKFIYLIWTYENRVNLFQCILILSIEIW